MLLSVEAGIFWVVGLMIYLSEGGKRKWINNWSKRRNRVMAKKDDMSIMLGMLVELGLLEVTKNGAYITTKKGQEALAEYGYSSWDAWMKVEK